MSDVGSKTLPEISARVKHVLSAEPAYFDVLSVTWKQVEDPELQAIVKAGQELISAGLPITRIALAERGAGTTEQLRQWARLAEFEDREQFVEGFMPVLEGAAIQREGINTLYAEHQKLIRANPLDAPALVEKARQRFEAIGITREDGSTSEEIRARAKARDMASHQPFPMPTSSMMIDTRGGLKRYQVSFVAASEKHGKTTALYNTVVRSVVEQKKHAAVFHLDAGDNERHLYVYQAMYLEMLLRDADLPLEGVASDGSPVWAAHEDNMQAIDLGISIDGMFDPRTAKLMEDVGAMWDEATSGRNGNGKLSMFDARSTNGGRLDTILAKLRRLHVVDGLDFWGLDHTKLVHTGDRDEGERIPRAIYGLTEFTNRFGPPCMILSQRKEISKDDPDGTKTGPNLYFGQVLQEGADVGWLVDRVTAYGYYNVICIRNRKGDWGPHKKKKYPLSLESGLILEGL